MIFLLKRITNKRSTSEVDPWVQKFSESGYLAQNFDQSECFHVGILNRWFRDVKGFLQPVHASSRLEPSQDILLIKRLKPEDSGRWTCKVFNTFGEERLDIHLDVVGHLSVHVLPQLQVSVFRVFSKWDS